MYVCNQIYGDSHCRDIVLLMIDATMDIDRQLLTLRDTNVKRLCVVVNKVSLFPSRHVFFCYCSVSGHILLFCVCPFTGL